MNTISDAYRAQQVELHTNPAYGVASIAFAPLVAKLIVDNGIKSLSDYGAGKKNLQRALEPAGISIDDPMTQPSQSTATRRKPIWSAALMC
jgi:hypothetical protein